MDVGIRELRSRLSELLDRAERGETIRVTDRGRPKAVLGPIPGQLNMQEGVEQGWIRPATGTPTSIRRRFEARRSIHDMLGEDRGE
jgi:prevent-host-death family protein